MTFTCPTLTPAPAVLSRASQIVLWISKNLEWVCAANLLSAMLLPSGAITFLAPVVVGLLIVINHFFDEDRTKLTDRALVRHAPAKPADYKNLNELLMRQRIDYPRISLSMKLLSLVVVVTDVIAQLPWVSISENPWAFWTFIIALFITSVCFVMKFDNDF